MIESFTIQVGGPPVNVSVLGTPRTIICGPTTQNVKLEVSGDGAHFTVAEFGLASEVRVTAVAARFVRATATGTGAPPHLVIQGPVLSGGEGSELRSAPFSASAAAAGQLAAPGLRLSTAGAISHETGLAYLQLFDDADPPEPGAVPVAVRPLVAGTYAAFIFPHYRQFGAGIHVALSSSATTFEPGPVGTLHAESAP